ncbi:MAG: diguanylate cyclase [Betaproteobacteria bacterium]|nr:diguanylate cyclase [Betaproteobacteria bacterium]
MPHPLWVSVSLGAVLFDGHTGKAEDLLRVADAEMYAAKKAERRDGSRWSLRSPERAVQHPAGRREP